MKFENHIYTDNRRIFMNQRNFYVKDNTFDLVAIGDSITEGLNINRFQYVDFTWLNSGISGDISPLLNNRIEEDCLQFNPQMVSLMIGINDIRNYFNKMDYQYRLDSELELKSQIISNTIEIVNQLISAGATVIYTQVLPVNEIERNNGYINQFIDKINEELEQVLIGKVLLIKSSSFKNRVNNLDLNLTYDGLHLNELGYQVWTDKLIEQIKKIQQKGD